jgi:hypothetical protein
MLQASLVEAQIKATYTPFTFLKYFNFVIIKFGTKYLDELSM